MLNTPYERVCADLEADGWRDVAPAAWRALGLCAYTHPTKPGRILVDRNDFMTSGERAAVTAEASILRQAGLPTRTR